MNNNPLSKLFDGGATRAVLIGVLCILALFLLAQTIMTAENFGRPGNPATDTITVQGSGQATLPPDVAHISFTIQNIEKAVSDAQAATTKQANAAIGFVKGQGVADADLTTLAYNISPQYSYVTCLPGVFCQNSSKITGYQVSETIQVTIRNLATVGAMLGGLGTLGIQNVQGPDFTLDDSTTGYDAARADAIDKAKTQADLLAKQLGIHLGKIVNFSESSNNSPVPLYAMQASGITAQAASTPNVPAGENTYTASVSITYEIR
ncbi:MAG TPA: SIMPL domain-containing protein [Candidatus Paceibacterota bacterium]|nr:SIMPL domain-containing protein [Candidatus Paceibacterota bacterium]